MFTMAPRCLKSYYFPMRASSATGNNNNNNSYLCHTHTHTQLSTGSTMAPPLAAFSRAPKNGGEIFARLATARHGGGRRLALAKVELNDDDDVTSASSSCVGLPRRARKQPTMHC